jgi:hypothetical protein
MVSCQKGESQPFSGDPYMGSVHVRIEADGYKTKRDEGSGSAHFVDSTGKFAKLVVFGAIRDTAGDAGFSLDGVYKEKGWASSAGTTSFRIDETLHSPFLSVETCYCLAEEFFEGNGTRKKPSVISWVDLDKELLALK